MHKYVGLALILFLMWMSLSGVLMNHPHLIAGFSVPCWLVPEQYHPHNWNHSSITCAVFPKQFPGTGYLGGKLGVYKSIDGRVLEQPLTDGFPAAPFYRKTNHLFLLKTDSLSHLLAATNGGLYVCNLSDEKWNSVALGDERERVLKIIEIKGQLIVFTMSHVYASETNPEKLSFSLLPFNRNEENRKVSLVKLFFDLHDGTLWGLPGKLLFDATGLVLFFLSLSAFYIWYFPKKLKRRRRKKKSKPPKWELKVFRIVHNYHIKLGIGAAVILLIIGATGFFMRPPMLALLMGDIPEKWYPGPLDENPWQDKIHNALYDPVDDKILVEASDGLWQGPADFSAPFAKTDFPAPIFVMGTTVFDSFGGGGYLVGSFSGIFYSERTGGKVIDLLTNEEAQKTSAMRPAEIMVTGYFKTPNGEEYITAHRQGLLPLDETAGNVTFRMPASVRKNYRMSLWNYLFEIHNGRFFRGWIGEWCILLVPLGSLLLIIVTLSGVFDWLYTRTRGKGQA